jgi:hypothetical protein
VITETADKTSYTPIYIPVSTTFDRIAMRTSATFVGSAVCRLGIYNNSSSDQPSTVLLDAGTVSPTAATTNYEITISQTLSQGWYWLAINCQTAASTNSITAVQGQAGGGVVGFTGSSGPSNPTYSGYQESVNVSSGFATAGTLAGNTQPLIVWIRK